MDQEIREMFSQMGQQDSMIDALYRNTAASFGLTACEMWIYYFLLIEPESADGQMCGVTQQTICSHMMFPKQTVNSAVQKLATKGMLTIEPSGSDGRSKVLRLTPDGMAFARGTVALLVSAEMKAAEKLGLQKLSRIVTLREEFYRNIKKELNKNANK